MITPFAVQPMSPNHVDILHFSEERHAQIRDEIRAGERVVWVGCPFPLRYALMGLPIAVLGILIAVFSAFTVAGSFGFEMPQKLAKLDPWTIFAFMSVVAGTVMTLWPVWLAFRASQTTYVITNLRVIIFDGGLFSTMIKSFAPDDLANLKRRQYGDGSGDIIFDKAAHKLDTTGPTDGTAGFYAVEDVKNVEQTVRKLIAPDTPRKLDAIKTLGT